MVSFFEERVVGGGVLWSYISLSLLVRMLVCNYIGLI